MKKVLYALTAIAFLGLVACSNGDYSATPAANGGVNPLNPLDSLEYAVWTGEDPMRATVNGKPWKATSAGFSQDSTWANIVHGMADDGSQIYIYMKEVWANNAYNLPYKSWERYAYYRDINSNTYYTNLGNSSGVYLTRNDSARFTGRFYLKAVSPKGEAIYINNGWFNFQH